MALQPTIYEDVDEDAVCDVCELPVEDCICNEFTDDENAGNGDDEDGQYA